MSSHEATRADICALAVAECFRNDGEILVSAMGTTPSLGARLAKATFAPDLLMTDGYNLLLRRALPLGAKPSDDDVEGWMPFGSVFDTLWWGRRHVMMGASQIDQFGNQNIACIGSWQAPKAQLLGVRGAPGNTINHVTSYWVPNHNARALVPKVDVVSGVGYDRAAALGARGGRFHEIRRVVTNLGVFDFNTPDRRMRLASLHPGVELQEVIDNTGFELAVPDDLGRTPVPTPDIIGVLRELDPRGYAQKEVVG
ncbi:MAG: CoA-transferase [Deltaproteobacteria bacterium]|jgi:acyl CoA:acetate/3-ketoacid CoA transferase beta subunit|nr:CoA-transferase [Deltaproteobacteria bacterium]